MPLLKILTVLAVCDFCDARDAHVASRHEPLASEVFVQRGWLITDRMTVCRRCAPLAVITGQKRRDRAPHDDR